MIKTRKIILISGKTGFGKSYLANRVRGNFSRVLTVDPQREYKGLIFSDFQTLADYALNYDLASQSQFNIVLQPDDLEGGGVRDVLHFIKLGRRLENCLIAVEEAAMWSGEVEDELAKIAKFDRHRRVSLMLVSQRVVDLDIAIRSMATSIIAFNTNEPRDVARLEDYGLDVSRLSDLKIGEYIHKGETFEELTA